MKLRTADLDDHALVGVVPVAPRLFVRPVGGAEAELTAGEGPQHGVTAAQLAADRRRTRHPVDDVVGEVASDP